MVDVRLISGDTGTLGWETRSFVATTPAVVVKGTSPTTDLLFVGDQDGIIHQLALKDGSEQAQFLAAGGIVWGLAYADGVVYANAGDYWGSPCGLTAHKVNPPSLLWTQAMEPLPWGSPFVADGIVYSCSGDGKLYAIRADGTPAWISTALHNVGQPPIVANGIVYVGAWDVEGQVWKLMALNAQTGDVIWQSSAASSPVSFGAGRIYAAVGVGLRAFDAATGALLWSSPFGGPSTPPTFWGSRVFASVLHPGAIPYLEAFDAADGHLLWTSQVPVGGRFDYVSRAVPDGGLFTNRVYVTSTNGYLYAFHRTNGSLVWQHGIGYTGLPTEPTWTYTGDLPWRPGPQEIERVHIDPMALVLRGDIYVKLHLPDPPPLELKSAVVRVRQAAAGMSDHEKSRALAQLRSLDRVTGMLRKALTTPLDQPLKFDKEDFS